MRILLLIAVIATLGSSPRLAFANDVLPEGVSFIGLVNGEWKLLIMGAGGALRTVRTTSEPRTPAYSSWLGRAAYISAAGELREIDLQSSTDSLLLKPTAKVSYTQPAYRPRTDELYVVALRDGSSIETDIVRVDRVAKQTTTVLLQRSAQFEPAFSADGTLLLYSNVACASECPNVLQEIWTMAVVGGVAKQRTLLNVISRQPAGMANGAVLFVSNARGTYELWRSSGTGLAEPIGRPEGVAESPIVTGDGSVYFILRTSRGGHIARLLEGGAARPVGVAKGIEDVRDLRWGGP